MNRRGCEAARGSIGETRREAMRCQRWMDDLEI